MSKRFQDKKHLEYIASLPCLLCKAGFYSHSRGTQAHHLLKPADKKRGMSLKAGDDQVIPLCHHHHAMLHTKFGNEFKFFEHFGLPATFGQKWAKKLYDKKNCQDRLEDNDLPF